MLQLAWRFVLASFLVAAFVEARPRGWFAIVFFCACIFLMGLLVGLEMADQIRGAVRSSRVGP